MKWHFIDKNSKLFWLQNMFCNFIVLFILIVCYYVLYAYMFVYELYFNYTLHWNMRII